MYFRRTHPSPRLARFLYNNYVQALKIIREFTPLVKKFLDENNLTETVFDEWLAAELEYLERMKKEPPGDLIKITYYEALLAEKLARYVVLPAILTCSIGDLALGTPQAPPREIADRVQPRSEPRTLPAQSRECMGQRC